MAQGQLAWLASRGQETSNHVALVEWELKHLWVAVQLDIVGDFRQSPIPTSFRDLHSPVLLGHDSPPPLKSCSSRDSFISFREELNNIVEAKVPSVKSQGGLSHEVEAATSKDSEEAWEEVSEGDSGGGCNGGEGSP